MPLATVRICTMIRPLKKTTPTPSGLPTWRRQKHLVRRRVGFLVLSLLPVFEPIDAEIPTPGSPLGGGQGQVPSKQRQIPSAVFTPITSLCGRTSRCRENV